PHLTGGGFRSARVGAVVGVVGLDVPPAGPVAAGGRAGTDLHPAGEFGGGVVPDDAEEGEVPYGPRGEAENGGAGGAVVGEGPQGQRLGAAGHVGRGRHRCARGRSCRGRRSRGRRGGGRGERKGEGGGAGDTD